MAGAAAVSVVGPKLATLDEAVAELNFAPGTRLMFGTNAPSFLYFYCMRLFDIDNGTYTLVGVR